MAVGAVVTITFSVTVDQPDTGNHLLESTIHSTTEGTNCATGTTDVDCFSTVNVGELIIDASADPDTTTPGGVVRITGTFTNTGTVPYVELTVFSDLSDLLE